jgi:hypothetical protein
MSVKLPYSMQKIGTIAVTETNYNTFDLYGIMPVRIIVKFSENIAADLQHHQPSSPELEELPKIQRDLGITLEPVHPGVSDPTLASYFTVEVPDEDTAERVVERLKLCKAVDGAYIKPSDELPGATI